MYTLKNVLVLVSALADAQQEQSTLQNTETWNTANSKKCHHESNYCSHYQTLITTDGFEVD